MKLKKFKGHTIDLHSTAKAGDTVICINPKSVNYGLMVNVHSDCNDNKNWKVIVQPVKTYKLWVVIEEHSVWPDGSDSFKDIEPENAVSLSTELDTLEAAHEAMVDWDWWSQ